MHQFSTIRGEYRSWIQRTSLKELSTTQPSSSYHLVDEFKFLSDESKYIRWDLVKDVQIWLSFIKSPATPIWTNSDRVHTPFRNGKHIMWFHITSKIMEPFLTFFKEYIPWNLPQSHAEFPRDGGRINRRWFFSACNRSIGDKAQAWLS